MTTADTSEPTFGTEPPRAAIELDPAEVAVLYPCLEPVPHDRHVRSGVDGATLWRYSCDGQCGVYLGPPRDDRLLAEERDDLVAENAELRLRIGDLERRLTTAYTERETERLHPTRAHTSPAVGT